MHNGPARHLQAGGGGDHPGSGEGDDRRGLREQLLAAVSRSDNEGLLGMCRAHADAILEYFPAWQADAADDDEDARERYVGGLYAVAKVFANHLGRTEPLAA